MKGICRFYSSSVIQVKVLQTPRSTPPDRETRPQVYVEQPPSIGRGIYLDRHTAVPPILYNTRLTTHRKELRLHELFLVQEVYQSLEVGAQITPLASLVALTILDCCLGQPLRCSTLLASAAPRTISTSLTITRDIVGVEKANAAVIP